MDSFHGLTPKSPSSWHRTWLQVQIFYDHVNPATRRTIDQAAGDFAKSVKAISLPQDVPSTSDHLLIELENQVQRLMEAHLAPKSSVQVNKIASSSEFTVVPPTLNIAWKILSKILLNMHPRVQPKWEASGTLSNPGKTILVTPIIRHGKVT
ncbi:hypothetical protein Tco_0831387 [Tanacetum coccineum]